MSKKQSEDRYEARLATFDADIASALRLRYRVFVEELGADGPGVDHATRTERDEFDAVFDHLVLVDRMADPGQGDHVVGVYRLLPSDRMPRIGRFYSESEFDLTLLKASGRKLLELGRSCIHADHRGGTGMFHLWNALARYVLEHEIDILFGAASFPGTDLAALAEPLSLLHHAHLAPPSLRVRAHGVGAGQVHLLPAAEVDRRKALAATPALIKAYLRLGGFVGEGVFVDHAFNTTDVCLVLDTNRMSQKHKEFYLRKGEAG
ncbi:MAG: GNAT family N-acyltransferase [Pseudotabrizicola sp.]|uniref:GNAT family N-acetyltransferase n=1 Tax=Pseudotabrizicola sp. TaxID=2939647 RepID=UPI00271A3CBD|nr:GNAT family N-acyltransferase [Pseudotabrizicola sp.]MDO8884941.1 GNAT family N-acyltransferase [Pseudotabrizicola sp.]MDP2081370.1 GNAT family N-acyltransferase [Pseudotabrizicola sp.]MDZ7575255.1 GNAT family N-acyltransferase [Pseudotabrizicola sp.]